MILIVKMNKYFSPKEKLSSYKNNLSRGAYIINRSPKSTKNLKELWRNNFKNKFNFNKKRNNGMRKELSM